MARSNSSEPFLFFIFCLLIILSNYSIVYQLIYLY